MARFVHYRCPDCGGTFRWLHHPSDSEPPDRCQLCHSWMSDEEPPEEVFVPQAPGIRKSAYAKSIDQTYRAMEESSAQRAEEAADVLRDQYRKDDRESPFESDPAVLQDFQRDQVEKIKSELKITNMRDPSEMREGDTATMAGGEAVAAAQRLSIGPNRPGFQNLGGMVPNSAPGVGPARAGAGAHSGMTGHGGWIDGTPPVANPQHQARAAAVARAGEIGSYKE